MSRYIEEVIAAHVAIEAWLNQGTGSIEGLMQRFSAEFTMIPINGTRMDQQAVSAFSRGSRQPPRQKSSLIAPRCLPNGTMGPR